MQNDFNNPVSRKKAMEKAVKEANEDQKKMMPSPDKREERINPFTPALVWAFIGFVSGTVLGIAFLILNAEACIK